ncbi:hypothetical protein SEA_FRANKLIN22_56 [Microbacterium phage Franklin22]|uniref:hypothetical protein n=1 Tax=Microbacterium phage Franklin22 TaxID=2894293 RepID=UPI001E6F73EF|nr:hypothetical protein QDW15_gp56 [Microbacterium phage Franklin22]UGL61869.1 hypothetical protein SEA_FRANKLIN22_56 [Microbacterium phage Franklin22]
MNKVTPNPHSGAHYLAPGSKVVRDYDDSHVGTVLDQARGAEVLVQFECEAEPLWCYPHDLEPAE